MKALKKILEDHSLWLKDNLQGEKADLRDANLRDADLRDANLCDANLCDANLCGANLRDANLRYIVSGNIYEVCTFQIPCKYTLVISKESMAIGCIQKTLDEWLSLSEEQIKNLSSCGDSIYKEWGFFIKQLIEKFKEKE